MIMVIYLIQPLPTFNLGILVIAMLVTQYGSFYNVPWPLKKKNDLLS